MTVLVTGASGFIGRHLIAQMLENSIRVRVACRHDAEDKRFADNIGIRYLSGAGRNAHDWMHAVEDCTEVVHLAARAHVVRDRDKDPLRAFRSANVDFARACAEAAVGAGVKRFIFLSSVGVHGNTSGAQPFCEDDAICPHNKYASSKAEAEQALTEIAHGTSMDLTVIRPPLVYGPAAPGNFRLLRDGIAYRIPLPLGSVTTNRRSFVSIYNLIDLILTCLSHPGAANQTFLVSDGEDISTSDFLLRLGVAMGKPVMMMPFPQGWLAFAAKLLGKQDVFQSLCGSLQVDISKVNTVLGWRPPITMIEGLRRSLQPGPKFC